MSPRVTLITCSFRGDLDLCRLMCASVDALASPDFEHRLYVPRRDLHLFANLAAPRRRLATQESLLPRGFWKVPLPSPEWRARVGLPRRNFYLTTKHGFVRGWIAQQLMKIAASLDSPSEIVAHIDSDAALVRPLEAERLARDGLMRLYAGPVERRHDGHAKWYAAAARLLGTPAGDFYDVEYIAPLVVWRRSVVEAMTARIAATTGRAWADALAGTSHFSEYVLYGVFAEHVLGLEAAGHFRDENSLSLSRWSEPLDDDAAQAAFLAGARSDQLLCCLQSTLALPLLERARLYREATLAVEARRREEGFSAAA